MIEVKFVGGSRLQALAKAFSDNGKPNYGAIASSIDMMSPNTIKPSSTSIKSYAEGKSIPGGIILYYLAKVCHCRMEDFFQEHPA